MSSKQYVNVEKIHPDYDLHECWYCGNEWYVRRPSQRRVCTECFWGQDEEDPTDYGDLWYGKVSREEKKRLYAETRASVREKLKEDITVPSVARWSNVPTKLSIDE